MRSILSLALKDIRILLRDKAGIFWVLGFPIIMALFFGSIFSMGGSGAGTMRIAFCSVADSNFSRALKKNLEKSEALEIVSMTPEEARSKVAAGKLAAFVLTADSTELSINFIGGKRPGIVIGIDPARRAEAGYLEGLVNQAYFEVLQTTLSNTGTWKKSIDDVLTFIDTTDTGLENEQESLFRNFMTDLKSFMASLETTSVDAGKNRVADASEAGTVAQRESTGNYETGKSGTEPDSGITKNSFFAAPDIKTEKITISANEPVSSWEITFPQALQWAFIGCVAAFALSMVLERTRGTLIRLRLSPMTMGHILAGKGLGCFLACTIVSSMIFALGIFIFDIRVQSPSGLAAAILASSFCFVGIMIFISVLGKTERAVSGAGWGILLVMSMTGGGMVPLIAMPRWMQIIGTASPVKWSVLALEGAVWRGFTPEQMLQPIIILVAAGIFGFGAGVMLLRRFG